MTWLLPLYSLTVAARSSSGPIRIVFAPAARAKAAGMTVRSLFVSIVFILLGQQIVRRQRKIKTVPRFLPQTVSVPGPAR